MTEYATVNIKLGLYNVENLFLMFDHPIPENYKKLPDIFGDNNPLCRQILYVNESEGNIKCTDYNPNSNN